MSREIEFRGVPSLTKEELEYADIPLKNGFAYGSYSDGDILGRMIESSDEYCIHEWWCPIINETLEQYTGLHDKNGKKIYEGDIDLVSEGMYGVIIWKKGGFWIKWPGRYKPFEEFLTPEMDGQLDIVGDIHNNPELLEAES